MHMYNVHSSCARIANYAQQVMCESSMWHFQKIFAFSRKDKIICSCAKSIFGAIYVSISICRPFLINLSVQFQFPSVLSLIAFAFITDSKSDCCPATNLFVYSFVNMFKKLIENGLSALAMPIKMDKIYVNACLRFFC